MEQIHGIDVSWMTHGSSKDKPSKPISTRRRNTLQSQPLPPLPTPPNNSPRCASPLSASADTASHPLDHLGHDTEPDSSVQPSSPATGQRLQRRPSWFSNLSSKFSSGATSSPPQATNTTPKQAELSIPRANPTRNAVLQHAAKCEGQGPYIPAPPKANKEAGLFHVLRRLSSSGGALGPITKGSHGLVERKILNVDRNRQRCKLQELNQAKLRRVAFCVDVEIAPMPKYADADASKKATVPPSSTDGIQMRKTAERSEGEAMKNASVLLPSNAKDLEAGTANAASSLVVVASTVTEPTVSPTKLTAIPDATAPASSLPTTTVPDAPAGPLPEAKATDATRKREKKKKNEEERKARKERKRRLAEANGTIPMEIYVDSDDSDMATSKYTTSSSKASTSTTARIQVMPTTNPVRIYRRCCQLRETPILKKITEQLSNPAVFSSETGIVTKLDLTGYWMQLADLVTLGDFLAVVPVKDVILENCGLNDEGLRVILAGLLAARKPEKRHIHLHNYHHHQHAETSHHGNLVPVTASPVNGVTPQSGFVERLVLKDNKVGVEGWRYICLFVYMCRSLKTFDLSKVVFPVSRISTRQRQASQLSPQSSRTSQDSESPAPQNQYEVMDVCQLLAKSIGERLGGSTLELVNFCDVGFSTKQLGWLVDGLIQSGIKRLGLAHNDLDDAGVKHVARYLASGVCEGLDLGGNDVHDQIDLIAEAAATGNALWGLSLADCSLTPSALCKLLPKLVNLPNLRFLNFSHNHALFETTPSATSLFRRYLPMMESLKRLHLTDVAMTSEQAIAIAEIIPEIKELAHLNILQNPELSRLAEARTEEAQEQACAFYASFLAATRLSSSIMAVDMVVPPPESSEIVRAMAKQVLAYCLRNVDRVALGNAALVGRRELDGSDTSERASEESLSKSSGSKDETEYPDVIQHLVGHDAVTLHEGDDVTAAPDDDYVIGGTGVAQALECCLKNRGSESGRPTIDFVIEDDRAAVANGKGPTQGKAKDMSKHLLQSARKIRARLQPALLRAKAGGDNQAHMRLLFLDNTLDGIIKRFEDEFPETRVSIDSGISVSLQQHAKAAHQAPMASDPAECEADSMAAIVSDGEDETDILPPNLSRSSSIVSLSSKGLTNEEGRALRTGHRLRNNWFKHINLLLGVDDIELDEDHNRALHELITNMNNADINRKLEEKGPARLFREDRQQILDILRDDDPEDWERFMESQAKARANLKIDVMDGTQAGEGPEGSPVSDEAIVDD